MGFSLMDNFDRPYLSRSITEFWRRWHISLSTWFKDYVYIPLGGNRVVKWRWYYNLFLTFLLSGLWHGANWTFLIWGAWHGGLLVWERISEPGRKRLVDWTRLAKLPRLHAALGMLATFVLVVLGWIFFRAENVHDAFHILGKVFVPEINLNPTLLLAHSGPFNFALCLLAIGLLALSYLLPKELKLRYSFAFAILTTLVILILGKGGNGEFIYFQF